MTHATEYDDALPMRWVSAVAPEHAARNARWRLGVGAPFVRDYLPVHGRAIDRLTIVSWNVHVGSGEFLRFVDDLRAGRLTNGTPITDFVMLVQETFRTGDEVPSPMPGGALSAIAIRYPQSDGKRLDADTLAREAGLFVAYVPSMRNGARPNPLTGVCEDRGNAIFSTMRLDDITAVELPLLTQRRVALLSHVSGVTSTEREWTLQIGTVHLDLRALPRGRTAQARMIAETADAPACVIGGDLNVIPWFERTHAVLAGAFPHTNQGDTLPTHVKGVRTRIDFQFYRLPEGCEALPYYRVASLYNSDHHPLIGHVRFA